MLSLASTVRNLAKSFLKSSNSLSIESACCCVRLPVRRSLFSPMLRLSLASFLVSSLNSMLGDLEWPKILFFEAWSMVGAIFDDTSADGEDLALPIWFSSDPITYEEIFL